MVESRVVRPTLSAQTFAVLTLTATTFAALPAAPPTNRSVFVTVTDGSGSSVTDLVAADFVVKEGGKEREILKAERATSRMRLALAVEERLLGDTSTRVALFEFAKRLEGAAEISLITIGLSNTTVVDYTTSLETVVTAINKFSFSNRRDSNVAEGVLELAAKFVEAKPERPVLVVACLAGGQAGVDARAVLDKLRQSGAMMYVAALAAGQIEAPPLGAMAEHSGREQVLGDGPKQSGGRRVDVTVTAAMPRALQQIAGELLSQYVITYALPDGVKPDRRFNVSVKRRGVSLRAPSLIPDR